ncbi:peptide ABC transporter permease [Fusobacterium necrophorum DAB]|uniref:ABC transporter permease n=1 Tax=Fusobacterium necrophorum TaxID=859 RepID=UPI000460B8D7|nr:ABC transporter permease [Fusobacterium necrophorum]KDE68645.1 peptide ABC transporter permease [Fusobacterium necrophorum DAB]
MKLKKLFCNIEIYIILVFILFSFFFQYSSFQNINLETTEALVAPNAEHILGTDDLGFDIFSQLIYGGRTSLEISFFTAIFSAIGGSMLGAIAGYFGAWKDKILLSIIDIFLSISELPLMIVMGAFLGTNLKNIVFVLVLVTWTRPAKIARNEIIKLKQEKYILLSKAYGGNFFHIFRWHLLKPVWSIIVTAIVKIMNKAILAEASLAYLGLRDPLSKSWGMIISRAMSFPNIYFTEYYKWWLLPPLILLMVLVVTLASLGEKLEKL